MTWFTVIAIDRQTKSEIVLLDLATRQEAAEISMFLRKKCECDIEIVEAYLGGKHNG